jgi:hypothetical protein
MPTVIGRRTDLGIAVSRHHDRSRRLVHGRLVDG